MKKMITILLIAITVNAFAQTDTIFTNGEKIPCVVKKMTQDAVEYVFPGEEMTNTVYKNTVQKIVFKSGRVQTFAETTSFKTVNDANDFENVSLTSVQNEINGLFKLGDVSSKAKATTVYASMEKVKERAIKKIKIVAAMMGANIIYLTQNATGGNQVGTKYQAGKTTETNLSGIAYSNKLPKFDEFNKLIGAKTQFQCVELYKMSQNDADMEKSEVSKNVEIIKVSSENGLIMVKAKIDKVENDTFRVVSFNSTEFTLVWKDGEKIYNYKLKI